MFAVHHVLNFKLGHVELALCVRDGRRKFCFGLFPAISSSTPQGRSR